MRKDKGRWNPKKSRFMWIARGYGERVATLYISKPKKEISKSTKQVSYWARNMEFDLSLNSTMGLKQGECRHAQLLF